jgi:lipopolysaccharide transport protein LptA
MFYHLIYFCLLPTLLFCKKVTINADELSYKDKEKKSFANGHAIAVLTEDKKIQTLKADNLVIYHDQEKNDNDDDNIERIDALKNVEFESDNLLLTADNCTYEKKNKQILCTGCVHIKDQVKNYEMHGDEGIFDLEQETYFVKKNPACKKQVQAVFMLGK